MTSLIDRLFRPAPAEMDIDQPRPSTFWARMDADRRVDALQAALRVWRPEVMILEAASMIARLCHTPEQIRQAADELNRLADDAEAMQAAK